MPSVCLHQHTPTRASTSTTAPTLRRSTREVARWKEDVADDILEAKKIKVVYYRQDSNLRSFELAPEASALDRSATIALIQGAPGPIPSVHGYLVFAFWQGCQRARIQYT